MIDADVFAGRPRPDGYVSRDAAGRFESGPVGRLEIRHVIVRGLGGPAIFVEPTNTVVDAARLVHRGSRSPET